MIPFMVDLVVCSIFLLRAMSLRRIRLISSQVLLSVSQKGGAMTRSGVAPFITSKIS